MAQRWIQNVVLKAWLQIAVTSRLSKLDLVALQEMSLIHRIISIANVAHKGAKMAPIIPSLCSGVTQILNEFKLSGARSAPHGKRGRKTRAENAGGKHRRRLGGVLALRAAKSCTKKSTHK